MDLPYLSHNILRYSIWQHNQLSISFYIRNLRVENITIGMAMYAHDTHVGTGIKYNWSFARVGDGERSYSPALFGSRRRVAEVTIVDARLAVERLAEPEAHRTLFGGTTTFLTDFTASGDSTSLAGWFSRSNQRDRRIHRCRWCRRVGFTDGHRSVHRSWRRNRHGDCERRPDPINIGQQMQRVYCRKPLIFPLP